MGSQKADTIAALRTEILRLEGFKSATGTGADLGLGPIIDAFPNRTFPTGAVHEFTSSQKEDAAATSGFIGGLLSSLMSTHGAVLWISSSRTLFPPALKAFSLSPDRFIFVDLKNDRDVIWAMD